MEQISLRRQLKEAKKNLSIILERKSQYVMKTDIPLQLIKEERELRQHIAHLKQRIVEVTDMMVDDKKVKATKRPTFQNVSSEQPRSAISWAWLLLIAGLNFLAGVLGNLIAAWIQRDLFSDIFTLPRIVAISIMTVVVLVVGAWVQYRSLPIPKWGGVIIIVILLTLTALVAIVPSIFLSGGHSFDYAVQVQAKDTGESIPNAEVRVDVGGGKPPMIGITDVHGFATIAIDASYSGQLAVLTVEATGYGKHRQEIKLILAHSALVVQMEPAP